MVMDPRMPEVLPAPQMRTFRHTWSMIPSTSDRDLIKLMREGQ